MKRIETEDFFSIPKNTRLYLKIADELIRAGRDNPVPDSKFEQNTRKYRRLKTSEYFRGLQGDKYDALVMYDDSYLYGYAAYQRQGEQQDEMHIFKLRIDEAVNGNRRLITKLTKQCLEHMRKKFRRVVFDKESDSREILKFLKTKETYYNISVNLETNSLCFLPESFLPEWSKGLF